MMLAGSCMCRTEKTILPCSTVCLDDAFLELSYILQAKRPNR